MFMYRSNDCFKDVSVSFELLYFATVECGHIFDYGLIVIHTCKYKCRYSHIDHVTHILKHEKCEKSDFSVNNKYTRTQLNKYTGFGVYVYEYIVNI